MDPLPPSGSLTYRNGFLDFLTTLPARDLRLGGHVLTPAGLARFNAALHAISPDSPGLNLSQIAAAGHRALAHCAEGGQPAFVTSRLELLDKLHALAADPGWPVSEDLSARIRELDAYRADPGALLPVDLPVVGSLDDALLIDAAVQVMRDELGEYEDFCRFRAIVAEREGISAESVGISRDQWLEARAHAQARWDMSFDRPRRRYVADARASLFHVV